MVQSPSWEANWFAASQEIPPISRNPNVHYRTHKRPPPVPVLGQPNSVHILTSHLLEIHPNIIHTSTSRSLQWSLSLRFPYQDPIRPPVITHKRHTPSPASNSLSVLIHTVFRVQVHSQTSTKWVFIVCFCRRKKLFLAWLQRLFCNCWTQSGMGYNSF